MPNGCCAVGRSGGMPGGGNPNLRRPVSSFDSQFDSQADELVRSICTLMERRLSEGAQYITQWTRMYATQSNSQSAAPEFESPIHQYPVASAASTLADTHFREAALPVHYYFIVFLIGAAVALMVVTLGAVVVASLS
jgi:hypothetical protein